MRCKDVRVGYAEPEVKEQNGASATAGRLCRGYRLQAARTRPVASLPLQLIRGDYETFNRFALDESIHNLRDVRDRDVPVKKVIGFD